MSDETTICARKPWSADAECVIVRLTNELTVPDEVKQDGFEYFLEVDVAREVLEVFGEKPGTLDEKVRLLICYATFDAYPDLLINRE